MSNVLVYFLVVTSVKYTADIEICGVCVWLILMVCVCTNYVRPSGRKVYTMGSGTVEILCKAQIMSRTSQTVVCYL